MEKDVGKIKKNDDTDIIVRVDDFGGRVGVTIREFVTGERYTGFTKAGTRIPADQFKAFKEAVNSIDEKELAESVRASEEIGAAGQGNLGQGGTVESSGKNVSDSGKSGGKDKSSGGIKEQAM